MGTLDRQEGLNYYGKQQGIISDVGAFIMTSLVKLVGSSIQSDSLP